MSHARILLVEDELIVALELEDRLRREGYVVVGTARSADEALAIVDATTVDLAIVDLRLVGPRDGVELARELITHDIPFVFLTAHGDNETLARIKSVEPLGYLLKPFNGRLLRLTIETALHRHAGERARLAAVRAQRAAEAVQAAILEHSPDAVLVLADDGVIEVSNRATARIFGCNKPLGRIDRLLPGLTYALARRQSELGTAKRLEGRRCDGTRFPAEVSYGLAAIDGRERVILIVRDITVQTQLNQQLARSRQLEVAGQVASGVAHDLNNLLSVVWMNSYLLRHASGSDVQTLLGDLDRAVSLGASLTTRLSSMARHSGGKPRAVPVNEAVRAITKLAHRAMGSGVEVTLDLDGQAGAAWVDPAQLDQLILNLAINADRAMPEGGRLTLRTRAEDDHAFVVIEIEDTGVGIDEATSLRLFEPFFTTRAHSGGTGLGLSIVNDIVQSNGGSLEFESELGRGTVFRVRFPRHGPAGDELDPSEQLRAGAGLSGVGRTVLLVDDNELHRHSIARLVEAKGFRALHAPGPGEALLIAEREAEPLALAIVDVQMPYMDGPELAERLERTRAKLPVLLVSGSTNPLTEQVANSRPILRKPIEPDLLFEVLAQLLAESGTDS